MLAHQRAEVQVLCQQFHWWLSQLPGALRAARSAVPVGCQSPLRRSSQAEAVWSSRLAAPWSEVSW